MISTETSSVDRMIMIRTVAELLSNLINEALPMLDSSEVKHAPTIGDMYEGLSKSILERAVPAGTEIQVVKGFATDGKGNMSGQLDCMLVRGSGDRIPYTDHFVWHIKDVIAVIEVKKTLHKEQMGDAIEQLNSVKSLEDGIMDATYTQNTDVTPTLKAFAETTGRILRLGRKNFLPLREQAVLNVLLEEQISAIRIVLGLHGYKSEANFRAALLKLLGESVGTSELSPSRLPQLIISGNYSLVKANGRPYSTKMIDGEWPIYFSTPVNPLIILLEIIWSRLDELYDLTDPWGEDLEVEVIRGLLLAWREPEGWNFREISASDDELHSTPATTPWRPTFFTESEIPIVHRILEEEVIQISELTSSRWLKRHGVDPVALQGKLIKAGIVAAYEGELFLITRNCMSAVMPTGQFAVAENNTGRLTRWLEREARSGWTGEYSP